LTCFADCCDRHKISDSVEERDKKEEDDKDREENKKLESDTAPSSRLPLNSNSAKVKKEIPFLPSFLQPSQFPETLLMIRKTIISQDKLTCKFTPLLPYAIAKTLITNSYPFIFPQTTPLLSLATILRYLGAQYAVNSTSPAGYPARWALINAILALAGRYKIAPGSERELGAIVLAFWHNARGVLGDLILLAPPVVEEEGLVIIKALLAMALFVDGVDGRVSFGDGDGDGLGNIEERHRMIRLLVGSAVTMLNGISTKHYSDVDADISVDEEPNSWDEKTDGIRAAWITIHGLDHS
jgi:hypothetical protein